MEDIIRLLYAEDDPDWAVSIRMLLEENGFSVVIAEDGYQTREIFQQIKPDMVLLDIDMPGKNGWDLICELKRIDEHWIAFGLLSAIGIQMMREGFGKKEETKFDPLSYKVILTLAVATSIDAMAVGVSMAFMQIGSSWDTIAIPAVLIAAISSALTIAGLGTGIFIGRKIPCSIAPVGGLILIGIGIKIIIEHLGLCS